MDAATSTPVAAPAAPVAAPIVAPASNWIDSHTGQDVTAATEAMLGKAIDRQQVEAALDKAGIRKTGNVVEAKAAAVASAEAPVTGLSFGPLGMSKEEVSAVTSKLLAHATEANKPAIVKAIEDDAKARGWSVDTRTPQEIEHDRAFPRPNSVREYGITNGDLAGAMHALDLPVGIGRSLANDMQATAAKLSGMTEGQLEAWEHQQMLDLGPGSEKLQSQARWVLGRLDPAQRQRLWPDSGRVSAQTVLLLAQAAQRFHARSKGYF